MTRLTRQGVRDLGGGLPRRAERCRHFWSAELVVVGRRWEANEFNFHYEIPVYGKWCMHCGETRE